MLTYIVDNVDIVEEIWNKAWLYLKQSQKCRIPCSAPSIDGAGKDDKAAQPILHSFLHHRPQRKETDKDLKLNFSFWRSI